MPFLLKRGDSLLATLAVTGSDNFWLDCSIETTEAYNEVEQLILQATKTEDVDLKEKIWQDLFEMGLVLEIEPGFILEPQINPFAILVYEDGSAKVRY